ncbi:MAG: 16S rRNA (uracil(1498)-N(3))-methyltransferase [Bacilli bacterium]|nr:16S rRNA (uracil(1498)-N(3))-methyltransferase [Bacilli bacterium]
MQRYFANKVGENIILGDGDVHHLLHVMRAKKGDEIEAVADNKLYACIIESISPLVIKTNYEIPTDSELKEDVTLFFALAKGEKIDFVIQKATELGAGRIVLLKTERCVVKFEEKNLKHKLERFEKIAKEASEQSHRLRIPGIVGVVDIKNIPQDLLAEVNLIAYEKEAGQTDSLISHIEKGKTLSVMIGPEGGFSEEEVKTLVNKYGFVTVSLGKRILRTETAAVYALSVIGALLEK